MHVRASKSLHYFAMVQEMELAQFCDVVAIGDELEAPIVELCLLVSELCTESQ